MTTLLDAIERCYDAIPRQPGVRAEDHGSLVLFVREGDGWAYYCRPRLGATSVTAQDITAVRARQRELGVPEAFEWVHETTPGMLAAAKECGLRVLRAPLMVFDQSRAPGPAPSGSFSVRLLDPDSPTIADQYALAAAVASVGFGALGTEVGTAGTVERDALLATIDRSRLAAGRARLRQPFFAQAVAETTDGVVASGALQGALGCAEVVGVATLPAMRRRGLAAAVTAALTQRALEQGAETVFLSAASEAVAHVYAGIGFTRIATACIVD
jgi:N-acetylglutamate synthase-like GNAT family acetyltransferase